MSWSKGLIRLSQTQGLSPFGRGFMPRCTAINTPQRCRRAVSRLLGGKSCQHACQATLHVPCTEDHFQPIKGFLRPGFRPSMTLCNVAWLSPGQSWGDGSQGLGSILLLGGRDGASTLRLLCAKARKSLLVTAGLSPGTFTHSSQTHTARCSPSMAEFSFN